MSKEIAAALRDTLISPNESDRNMEPANIVDGLFAIARGLDRVATAIERLGVNDAATPMGAIELVAKEIKDGLRDVGDAIEAAGNR